MSYNWYKLASEIGPYGYWISPEGEVYNVGLQNHGGIAERIAAIKNYSYDKNKKSAYTILYYEMKYSRILNAKKSSHNLFTIEGQGFTPKQIEVALKLAENCIYSNPDFKGIDINTPNAYKELLMIDFKNNPKVILNKARQLLSYKAI